MIFIYHFYLLIITCLFLIMMILVIGRDALKFEEYDYNLFKDSVWGNQYSDNRWYKIFQTQFRDRQLAQKYEEQVPKMLISGDKTELISLLLGLSYCCGGEFMINKIPHFNGEVFMVGSVLFDGFLLGVVMIDRSGYLFRSNPELVPVLKMIRSGKLQDFIMNTTTCHHLRANLWLLQNIYLFYALLNPQTYAYTRNYFHSHQGAAKIKQFLTVIQKPALQKCLTTDQSTFAPVQVQIAQAADQLVASSLTLLQQGLPVDLTHLQTEPQQQRQLLHQGQQVLQQYQQATHPQAPDTTIDQASQTLKQAQAVWSSSQ